MRAKRRHALEMQLIYRAMRTDATLALTIAQQARSVGISLLTKRYSAEEMSARDGPLMQGRFQIALLSLVSTNDPDVSWLFSCDHGMPTAYNLARYCSTTIDRALDAGVSSFDRGTRFRAYSFIQKQLSLDMPYDFICQRGEIDVVPARLSGKKPQLQPPLNLVLRWR